MDETWLWFWTYFSSETNVAAWFFVKYKETGIVVKPLYNSGKEVKNSEEYVAQRSIINSKMVELYAMISLDIYVLLSKTSVKNGYLVNNRIFSNLNFNFIKVVQQS